MTDSAKRCALCQNSVGETAVTDGEEVYCSPGCRRVGAELGTGDHEPTATQNGTRVVPEGDRSVDVDADTEQVFLHVDGMHCATCESFLEAVAEKQDGVVATAASYVTETIRLEYDPDEIMAEQLSEALTTVGYSVTPREELATVADERQRRPDQRQLDDLLGFRYAAGVLFGLFVLFPYVVVLYPAHASRLLGSDTASIFAGGPGPGSGIFLLPLFLGLTSVVVFFTGLPLLRGAYVSLVMRQPNTDLLVSLTIVSAYLYGTIAFLSGNLDVYYDLTIVIAAVVVAAIFYESLVKQRAVDRLTDLTVSQVEQARRLEPDGTTTETTVSDLTPGDRLLVRQGERVPVDGTLEDGVCTVDEAVVTGESLPVRKECGDPLVGGSLLTDGAATLRVGDPPTSSIDGITTAVWDLQSGTHGIQRRGDRLAARIVPLLGGLALVVALVTLAFGGELLGAVFAFLATFFVVSPWVLGLSTPLSVARSIEEAMERGIVIFDETVFERLRETDTVVFDKTGTLTTGEMRLLVADAPEDLLRAAAALEQHAAHPAGEAIASAVEFGPRTDGGSDDREPTPEERSRSVSVADVTSHATGIAGRVNGEEILVGNLALFADQEWAVSDDLESRAIEYRDNGDLPVILGRDGRAAGLVVLRDDPRPEWEETIRDLARRDIETVVLTGDDETAATAFADHPDVDHVFAGVPPEGKTATIRRLQARGHVTMVGDGTNDGPALAAADLGIALGGGTALASEAADITIVGDLGGVETAFELATAARRRLSQNTALALCYNCLTVPLAVVGLLNPLFVTGATVLSAGLVGLNSMRSLIE